MTNNLSIFEENLANRELKTIPESKTLVSDEYFKKISLPLFRFLFSYQSRVVCRNSLLKHNLEPSKQFHLSKKSSDNNKKMEEYIQTINEASTTFSVSGFNGNANLPNFKPKNFNSISYLNLSDCLITSSSAFRSILNLKSLTMLCLYNCGLFSIPPDLYKLPTTLKSLDFSLNYIASIPNEIHWEHIEGLNLSLNALDGWPANLNPSRMPNLVYLVLSNNKIKGKFKSSNQTAPFPNLQFLDLSYCALFSCPEWVFQLKSLTSLSLTGNINLVIPSLECFQPMTSLRKLNISGVQLLHNSTKKAKPHVSLEIIIARGKTWKYVPEGNYAIIHD
ncbi:hypothetical protein M9Y10_044761 [Tritrichomonas musculus]|uniref:Leucine Rich Repeat family protein n=1 Tax=Tritrichomonas musculus TaxID=1915356 RepID=A0ABR2JTN5_9EUKA